MAMATPTTEQPFVEMGSMEHIYGRITLEPDGHLTFTGARVSLMRSIVDEYRIGDAPDGTYRRLTDAEVFESLPKRLRGRTWAWLGPDGMDDDDDED